MKVTMIGTGYVGLVSGVCFAEIGHDVTCVDINPRIISMLKEGKSPIYEPGLSELIQKNYQAGRVIFSTDYSSVKTAKAIFLGVGTPSAANGNADLTYLNDAAVAVAKELADDAIVVIKSTVPVGTHVKLKELMEKHTRKRFYLVNNPEFLKEGAAIDDFMRPDRVIIGYREEYAAQVMEELYAPLVLQGHPIHKMSNLSAEMTKYASNSMLATKISFINEIAKLCDITGADIEEVRKGMASDRRIGPYFIYPGPGYGGSCFPKDVKALIYTADQLGLDLQVAKAVEKANLGQKTYMFEKMKKYFGDLKGKKFAFWGVAFKPKTDDIRETPAINMARALIAAGATVNYYDPEASNNFGQLMEADNATKGKTKAFTKKYDCLEGTEGLVLITEWPEFRAPDFMEIKARLASPNLFDCRNIFPISKVKEAGLNYFAIGKYIPQNNL